MEGDPFAILEGMTIGAYAIGAHEGFIYLPYEYTLAVKTLKNAIKQAREYGLLGKNILGSGFDFDIELRMGARSFVGGESTAIMHAIEGKPSEPRAKHVHTTDKGLVGSAHLPEQRQDLVHRVRDRPARRQVVRRHRHQDQHGHAGLFAGGQDQQRRAGRSADGHHRPPVGL